MEIKFFCSSPSTGRFIYPVLLDIAQQRQLRLGNNRPASVVIRQIEEQKREHAKQEISEISKTGPVIVNGSDRAELLPGELSSEQRRNIFQTQLEVTVSRLAA